MKLLQLCHKMPYPLKDGGAWSIYYTAMGLMANHVNIKVFAINTPRNWIEESVIPPDFRRKTGFECSTVDTRIKPHKALINLIKSQSYFVERFYSKQFNNDLIRILKNDEYDIIQLEHVYMCVYLKTLRKYSRAKIILRPQNVENQVWNRYLKNKISPLKKSYIRIATKRLEKFEKEVTKKVDGILAISAGDEISFNIYAPDTPSINVPVGFDFSSIKSYDINKQYTSFPVFYHLGSMDWLPNVQGIKWFIENVIPRIIEGYPDFIFKIAGKNMPEWIDRYAGRNIIVDGEVKDSLKYHEDKAIMIVPLLSGGGLRVKIVEAMALGKTLISTTIGAEGIPYTDHEDLLIADSEEEFHRQIKKCKGSEEFCREIGRKAHVLALENYDYQNIGKRMIQFYKSLT